MKSNKRIMKTFVSSVLALGMALSVSVASAGTGSSLSAVDSAIRSGGADAIISELERAEKLVCYGCVDRVMPLLDHDDYRVREAAAWWFSKRASLKAELTERSLAYLQVGTSVQARNSADIVGTFRDPVAVPTLAMALSRSDIDAGARLAITRALGTIGHMSANPAIAQAMQDSDPTVRFEALSAWQAIRNQTNAGLANTLLSDPDLKVRRQATAIVGVYRDANTRLALEANLSDPDAGVRRNAAWSLGRIGDAASREALLTATNDESGLVRRVARVSLGMLR